MAEIWTEEAVGPASYTTGGFVITTSLPTLTFFDVNIKTPGGVLGQIEFDVTLNSPAAGEATVRVMRLNVDPISAIGSPNSLPASITNRTTSGGSTDAQPSHTHIMDHNHAVSPASTVPGTPAGTVLTAATGPAAQLHTHTVDLPNFTQNTGAESGGNTHTWNSLYQHQPTFSNVATDPVRTELAAATVLSAATFNYFGTDG